MSPLLSTDTRLVSPLSFLASTPLPVDTISARLSGSPFTYHIPAKFRSAIFPGFAQRIVHRKRLISMRLLSSKLRLRFFFSPETPFFSNGPRRFGPIMDNDDSRAFSA